MTFVMMDGSSGGRSRWESIVIREGNDGRSHGGRSQWKNIVMEVNFDTVNSDIGGS